MTGSLQENTAQEQAIHTTEGPVILISCPGSGKTTTLIRRIHYMLETGIRPQQILMVTFSNAAAKGMENKYSSMYGENPGVTFATLHSFCLGVLRREGLYDMNNLFLANDAHAFLEEALNVPDVRDKWEMATAAQTAISVIKNNRLDPATYTDTQGINPELFYKVYLEYENFKAQHGLIDFDDMLLECLRLFQEQPDTLRLYQNMFPYIQCDEYQDVNYTQRDILYALAGKTKNLCVVGDDDQSIYRFRGARPEIMLQFPKDFPDAVVIHMDTNYRSGGKIVEYAGNLIQFNEVRFDKQFVSYRGDTGFSGEVHLSAFDRTTEEYDNLVENIKAMHEKGIPYNKMAILFRTNQQMSGVASALSAADIPFYSTENVRTIYDNTFFYDMKHYVALSSQTGTRADFYAILNHPNRYLRASDFSDIPYNQRAMLDKIAVNVKEMWKYNRQAKLIRQWMDCFGPDRLRLTDPPGMLFAYLRRIDYPSKYIKEYAEYRNFDERDMKEEYMALQDDAMQYKTIQEWFDHAEQFARRIRTNVKKKDREGVQITTMHKSKGLEWPVVFLPDANEGIVPHKKSNSSMDDLEEERRLFYVAMTRAMNDLFILSINDKSTRFISELDGSREKVLRSYKKQETKEEIKDDSSSISVVTIGDPKKDAYKANKQEKRKTLKFKNKTAVPMHLAGKKVSHKSFGAGTVAEYPPGKIKIKFPKWGYKEFFFPEAFEMGYLEYIDEEK